MTANKSLSHLRIIGGQWRSRRLPFVADAGVRPTADRIRETLFNWLQGVIPDARCLDLFAGSGALGFEALSRAAAHVTFVDEDLRVIQQLQQNATTLGTTACTMIWQNALDYLQGPHGQPYDIVFLDPPFRDDYLHECCLLLEQGRWLSANAIIYMESDAKRPDIPLLPQWELLKNKQAGQVRYQLARRL